MEPSTWLQSKRMTFRALRAPGGQPKERFLSDIRPKKDTSSPIEIITRLMIRMGEVSKCNIQDERAGNST